MASSDGSQGSELGQTQYPSQSTAFLNQRIWVSPEFENSLDLYQWIVQSHGAELVPDPGQRDVFHLLPKFQGETFNQLAESGLRIIAVPCLASSVKDGVPLPVVEDELESGRYAPIFSRALEGQTICCSHLSAALRKNIRTMVLLSNGQCQPTLTDNTSILITKRLASEKYFEAARRGIPIVTPSWIRHTFTQSKMMEPQNYLVPCFTQLVFCATNFDATEREKIKQQVLTHGATWSASLHKACTHLVVDIDYPDTTSEKLKYALQWKIKVVSQYWIRTCISHGFYSPIDDTTLHLTAENGESILEIAKESTKTTTSSGIDVIGSIAHQDTTSSSLQLSSASSKIGHTPYRRVSMRQSHLDIRSSMHRSSLTESVMNGQSAEEDDLEGDSPDDVDADSEEELDGTTIANQAVLDVSTSIDLHDDFRAPSSSLFHPNSTSMGLFSPKEMGKELQTHPNQKVDSNEAVEHMGTFKKSDLYNGLDRNTQEVLVTEALDLYFQPGATISVAPDVYDFEEKELDDNLLHLEKEISKEKETMPSNDPISSLGSVLQIGNYFKDQVITIVGVPDDTEDERMQRRMEELEEAVEEFELRGGTISMDFQDADVIVVFEASFLKPAESLALSKKKVVSSDWLTDSALLQLCQPLGNFCLTYSESSQRFIPKVDKFWTSSCVVESNPPTAVANSVDPTPHAPEAINEAQESLTESNGATGISKKLALAPSLKSARPFVSSSHARPTASSHPNKLLVDSNTTSNPERQPNTAFSSKKFLPIHQRNILPPTSYLLLQSALYVQTLRKIDKQRGQEAKKEKKTDREKKGLSGPPHTHKAPKSKPSDPPLPNGEQKAETKTTSRGSEFLPPNAPPPRGPLRSHRQSARIVQQRNEKPGRSASKGLAAELKPSKHGMGLRGAERMDVDGISGEDRVPRRRIGLEMSEGAVFGKSTKLPPYTSHQRSTRHGDAKNVEDVVVDDLSSDNSRDGSFESDEDSQKFENDQISIVGSPLTVTLRNQRKRKADDRPVQMDFTGVLKRKPAPIDAVPLEVPAIANADGIVTSNSNSVDLAVHDVHQVDREAMAGDATEEGRLPGEKTSLHKNGAGSSNGNGDVHVDKEMSEEMSVTDEDRFEFSPPLRFWDFSGNGPQPTLQEADGTINPMLLTQTMRGRGGKTGRKERHTAQNLSDPIHGASQSSPPPNGPPASSFQSSQWSQSPPLESVEGTPPNQQEIILPPVRILSVDPDHGSIEGGASVIVTLDRIEPSMKVVFGQVIAETFAHPTQAKLWATSPPSAVPLTVPLSILDSNRRRINEDSNSAFVYT